MASLYVFLDESGNFDFSNRGTNHFVLSAATTTNPLYSSSKLQKLKYGLLESGEDVAYFHASPDKQAVRDVVFETINNLRDIRVNHIYINKHKTHPDFQTPERVYGLLAKTLLTYIFNSESVAGFDNVIVIFDKALTNKQEKAFLSVLKAGLKIAKKPYEIYFHATVADFNAQIADYVAWAKYVQLERGETRPINSISKVPITSFDIFRSGTTLYY